MSGHSKWSQIKRQKGATDAKRGQLFTKLAKVISVAAKQGGGDPQMNPRLRIAIEQARAENMPKDNIERAIRRGTGELGGAAIEELRYEVYGPGGVGILVDAATDNTNRTTSEVKALLNKLGGKLAATGSVAFQFTHRGVISIPLVGQSLDAEALELAIIESSAESYENQGDIFSVQIDPKHLSELKARLEHGLVVIHESKLSWEPVQTVSIADAQTASQIFRLMQALDDLEDVTAVTANFDIPDTILSQFT